MRAKSTCAVLIGMSLLVAACERVNHENLDKWMRTKKGPDKLRAAVSDASIDADLSAHAAANLLRKQLDSDARDRLKALDAQRRSAVIAKLVPRLWDVARIEGGDLAVPNGEQASAKDLLVDLRGMVTGAEQAQIDGYLLDWYTSGFYDARATPGRHAGAEVVRMLGARAGEKLIPIANSVLAKGLAGAERLRLSDELLLAIAAAGSPETVKYLIELAGMSRGDKTQGRRAIGALYRAYVDPGGLFTVADPAGLAPHVQALVGFATSDSEARVINDAIALVRATGRPTCIEPLVAVAAYPHEQFEVRYIGASAALSCGGPAAIAPVVAALPDDASYEHTILGRAVWEAIAKMPERDKAVAEVRRLAQQPSKLARWVAIEALAAMGDAADRELVLSVASDRRKLRGYWGSQTDVSKKDRKVEPTLGDRARELSQQLSGAKGS